MTDFADWIRAEIKRRGWSQATLAELAGFSRSSVTAVLTTGRRKPGMRFFLGIVRAFEMPLAEVVVRWEAGERGSKHMSNPKSITVGEVL